jgi:hypothetical protein
VGSAKPGKIATAAFEQSEALGSPPALNLLFASEGIRYAVVFLEVNQANRQPSVGVLGSCSRSVLAQPSLDIPGAAYIEGTV